MRSNRKPLTAKEVDLRLKQSLAELRRAERNAVLWFGEVLARKLYKDLGYSSIHQYAELSLGFSPSKTSQFIRLCESLRELPRLRRSVARGELPWTKAREVAKVATARTEDRWIQEARTSSRRDLELKVVASRKRTRETLGPGGGQAVMALAPAGKEAAASGRTGALVAEGVQAKAGAPHRDSVEAGSHPPLVPLDVHLRMTAEQYARYQALLGALQKHGAGGDRTEVVLAGLEQLALAEGTSETERPGTRASGGHDEEASEGDFTRVNSRSPYQVVVQHCPECGSGRVVTGRGEHALSPRDLRAILCDAHRRAPGERNRAAVPERARRAVLERDRFRCRTAGCGRIGFLAVHHLVPREQGGSNRLENLITLCSGCHRALHASEQPVPAAP